MLFSDEVTAVNKQLLLRRTSGIVVDLLYYDRKGDEELGPEEVEELIAGGHITATELATAFRESLLTAIPAIKP